MAYINFESDRLLLRAVEEDDAAFVLELLNSPDWIKNIGDRGVKSLFGAKQYIQYRFIEKYKKEGFGMYMVILKESGLPIGQCGLVKRTYLEYPDLGFALLPAHQGKGYAYEAARLVLNHALTKLKFAKIMAITKEQNTGSRLLLDKLGLKVIGIIQPKGETSELLLFST